MSKYSELVYMVLDEVKGMSDDFTYTEDHIIFLLHKYRSFLLKQKYDDVKRQSPDNNYQTLELSLMQVPAISGDPCEGGTFLKSEIKLPYLLYVKYPKIVSPDFYVEEFSFVNRDRFRYVGHNKYLKNIVYCTVAPDNYMYFKSYNDKFLNTKNIIITGIFQDPQEVIKIQSNNINCNILDYEFPLEENLVSPMIELVVKELVGAMYRPKDEFNNASDDLASLNLRNK